MFSYSVGTSTTALMKDLVDGIGHYTQQLIEHLALRKIECQGFAFSAPKMSKITISGLRKNVIFQHSYQYYFLQNVATFGKGFRFNPGVDLYHCTDPRVMPMTCPTVVTFHDVIPIVHPEWFGGGGVRSELGGVLRKFRLKYNVSLADHIITISQHAANDLVKYLGVDERKITVIYNAADDKWYQEIDASYQQEVIKKYNLSEGYFLSVGTIQLRKNFDRLIDAYLSLPASIRKDRKLVIVGKYGWGASELMQRMRLLQQEGSLVWLSNVSSDDELRCIYKGASVFIFPSLYEGFGIPLIEAFASKIPVICSNVTSLPEVSGGAAIEVNPYVTGEISEAMRLLASDSAERLYRIKLGSIRAEQFRWKNTIGQTIDVYEKVLKEKN